MKSNFLEHLSKISSSFSHQIGSLDSETIYLWWTSLNFSEETLQTFISLLSEDEIGKANRYKFPHHRNRYQVVHGILRIILGRYLKLDPTQVNFTYSDRGKPYLADTGNPQNLQFNLSHSENLAIVGISRDARIGVDVEQLRSMENVLQLTERFFCPSEYGLLIQANPEERDQLFFQLWTAKEAYLKATGEGISGGLNQIEIGLNPLRFINFPKTETRPKKWHLESFALNLDNGANYWTAIAVEGEGANIQMKPLFDF